MYHQAIAEKISLRMYQLINLPAALAEIEKLRLIGVGITQQVQETEAHIEDQRLLLEELLQKQAENSASLFAATQDVDDVLAALYRPVDAPAAIVQELAKKARGKKVKEPAPEAVTEPPTEKHPCHLCEDVFYSEVSLVKHLRAEHKVSLEEAVQAHPAARSICANCVGDCHVNDTPHNPSISMTACTGYRNELSEDQVKWRDSTCQEWRACQFQLKCFGPANKEDPTCFKEDEIRRLGEKALAAGPSLGTALAAALLPETPLPVPTPCWNSSCAWGDLAQADHCDADEQFRDGRPVAECKCFVNGIGPTKGQDAAACFNTNCPSNNPEVPSCCEEWGEVWECPEAVTAGWGKAKEEEQLVPVDNNGGQRQAIIKAAIAAGDDINEYGAFRNSERVDIPTPKGCGHSAYINIATASDGSFYISANHTYPNGGSGGPPFISQKNYRDRKEAVLAGVAEIREKWLKNEKGTKRTKALAALGDFEKSINLPTPAASNEEAKQEVCTAVGESSAQASEVAQQVHPEDCDVCGNRGHLDDDSYCLCAHGRNRRQWDQEELERRKARKGELNAATQTEAATENHQAEPDSAEPSVCADPAEQITTLTPLDEPVGECELCMGYGVAEGETGLAPCTCEAGLKVKGGVLPSCCDKCSIEDPDCASCELLDKAAEPAELPKCANGSCTATGKQPKETCLRVGQLGRAPQDCKNFVPVDKCTHHMLKRSTRDDGSVRCDLCDFILRPSGSVDPATGKSIPQGGAAQPSAFQQKCPHPKPFREETESGVICKVCKLNLTQPALFA